jgi:hypothetical protein
MNRGEIHFAAMDSEGPELLAWQSSRGVGERVELETTRSGRPAPGHQHRHAVLVMSVLIAEQIDQITFLQRDADDDVLLAT